MGTTRIKVIDLASDQGQIKTSRKHAGKLSAVANIGDKKEGKKRPQEERAQVGPVDDETIEEKAEQVEEAVKSSPEQAAEEVVDPPDQAEQTKEIKKKTGAKDKTGKKINTHHKGKKYQVARKLIEDKIYSAGEAFEILPKVSFSKFDPSVEAHLRVVDKNMKVSVAFPHALADAKQKKVLIFTDEPSLAKASDGKQANQNVILGNEKTIDDIEKGTLKPGRDFDMVITTPAFMPKLAKLAKILGPRGMMPNPKNGTISENPQKTLSGAASGLTEFKSDPTNPTIHAKLGKLSAKKEELEANLKALIMAIGPSKVKGGVISSSMSPAIRVDFQSAV